MRELLFSDMMAIHAHPCIITDSGVVKPSSVSPGRKEKFKPVHHGIPGLFLVFLNEIILLFRCTRRERVTS
jgi:hypothetical protein